MFYVADDGNYSMMIEASNPKEAAEKYVDGGDWGINTKTSWVRIYVWGGWRKEKNVIMHGLHSNHKKYIGSYRIEIEPDVIKCYSERGHRWADDGPHCRTWGNGGGVISKEICPRCGLIRISNSWDYDPSTGEQGLISEEYIENVDNEIRVPDYYIHHKDKNLWLTSEYKWTKHKDKAGLFPEYIIIDKESELRCSNALKNRVVRWNKYTWDAELTFSGDGGIESCIYEE
jgi:hypothetical protein